MILSDERFATTTIVEAPRGPEPRLIDDFNCQISYERAHNDLVVVARWSHDYGSSKWIRTESAFFLQSPELHTPMASHLAAFEFKADAEALQQKVPGEVLSFEAIRR